MVACYIPPVTLTLVHSALQQMAASAALLVQAARVYLLMHVGVAQASTPLQERPSATVLSLLLLQLLLLRLLLLRLLLLRLRLPAKWYVPDTFVMIVTNRALLSLSLFLSLL